MTGRRDIAVAWGRGIHGSGVPIEWRGGPLGGKARTAQYRQVLLAGGLGIVLHPQHPSVGGFLGDQPLHAVQSLHRMVVVEDENTHLDIKGRALGRGQMTTPNRTEGFRRNGTSQT